MQHGFFRVLFYASTFFMPFVAEAKIIETATVIDIVPFIDSDTWVLVDLDNTTFEGKQALGHTEWFYDNARALMKNGMTLEEATRECYPEWIEVQKICPVKAIEAAFIPALVLLQQQGIIVMGLTHRQPSIADSTIRQVKSLGLSFSDSAPDAATLVVPSETPTIYDQGILFTGEYNKKGEIFVRFLYLINQMPKKIVFIDDKRGHVEDVESAVKDLGIEYTGVHYTAIENAEMVYYPDIARLQHKLMYNILSNKAALLLMEHGLE